MKYILIGSPTSPYVRKLRMMFHNRLEYEFKSINYLEKNDAAYLKEINPINKIPILLENDFPIYDSRVIYNYLSKKNSWTELTLLDENRLSAIDGLLDTCINLFCLRRDGLDLNAHNIAYIDRQKERIGLILNYLKPWVQTLQTENLEHWNIVSMSLYSFLYWGSFRNILDINLYPEMKKFLEDFKNHPGVQETNIPD